jgi:glycosyltransferase involved in cell wall biosynthesis
MDGGSKDGTVELLQQYPHLVWESEPDCGQSHALNKAFARARGEIIGWLNADDTYQPEAIHTAVAYLREHPEADLLYSDLRIIDEKGETIGYTKADSFDLVRLLTDNMVKQPTVFMRRAVLEKLSGVNETFHYVMDRELWLRAGTIYNLVYLPGKVLANFRMIPGTKTFEHALKFHLEWLQTLKVAFQQPEFSHINHKIKQNALRQTQAQYYFACTQQAIVRRNFPEMSRQVLFAFYYDTRLLINLGTWRILAQGIFGIKTDKVRKFRKASHV